MTIINPPGTKLPRIDLVDVLRGVALLAMVIYHFTWDLEFFGWLRPEFILQPGWVIFARSIAGSFLFLVGVSLFLSHGAGMRWASFRNRFVQIVVAAILISIVTWFAMPGGFIFFGILHGIALFSLLGLIFVRLHWSLSAAAAIAIVAVWQTFSNEIFFNPALWWVGLAPVAPPSNDYVPLFPWFAAVLAGIAIAKLIGLPRWTRLANISLPTIFQKPLTLIGRNSLIFYLVHQPILLGLLWIFSTFIVQPDKTPIFEFQCYRECSITSGNMFCTGYCGCMTQTLKQEKLFTPFVDRKLSEVQTKRLYEIRDICVAKQN